MAGPQLPGGNAKPSTGKQFGNYELLAPLAVGGTAEIWLSRIVGEAGFEKIVVVKQLLEHLAEDDEFVDMFLDEARLGSHLHHSNIVQTLELGKFAGRFFIAMEYVGGLTLAQTAAKAQQRIAGGLPLEITVGIVEQACAGLHYAHECKLPDGTHLKIVHRDVSPQNLVITFEGEVKVVDFGIAHAAVREARTKAGMIKGKFAYMSPEQCLGKPVDRRTDVFALGVVLFECATGQRLFKRKTTYETYQAIVKGIVTPPSKVNPRVDPTLEAIVMKALAYHPEDRWATAEDMADELEKWRVRNGKRVSSLDVQRFYDRHFQPELEEHRNRLAVAMQGEPEIDVFASSGSWDGGGGGDDPEVSAPGTPVELQSTDRDPRDMVRTQEMRATTTGSTTDELLTPAVAIPAGILKQSNPTGPTPALRMSEANTAPVPIVSADLPHSFPLPAPEATLVVTPPQGPAPVPVAIPRRAPTPVLPVAPETASALGAKPAGTGAATAMKSNSRPKAKPRERLASEPVPPPAVSGRGHVYVTIFILSLVIGIGALIVIHYLP
jgi:serine/threonine protein kinase